MQASEADEFVESFRDLDIKGDWEGVRVLLVHMEIGLDDDFDDEGEEKADDGREDLADVGADLFRLKGRCFEEEGFELVGLLFDGSWGEKRLLWVLGLVGNTLQLSHL